MLFRQSKQLEDNIKNFIVLSSLTNYPGLGNKKHHLHTRERFHFDVPIKIRQDGWLHEALCVCVCLLPTTGDDPPACDRGEDEPESISALQSTVCGRGDPG